MHDDDQLENKENTVLRSLVGDRHRHTPTADHPSPIAYTIDDRQPATMYAMETRYQPMPTHVPPKRTDPKVYYIDANRVEREFPPPSARAQSEEKVPTAFLQPKVLSQPILYNIAGRRTSPVRDEPPLPTQREASGPALYSITGRPRRPTVDMSVNKRETPTPRTDEAATVYGLASHPHSRDSIEETSKESIGSPPNVTTHTSPNIYSIVGNPARTSRGVQVSPLHGQRPSPVVYTIVGKTPPHTHRSMEKTLPAETTVYSLDHSVSPRKTEHKPAEPTTKATMYTLGGKSTTFSPQEHQTKPPARKRSPPPSNTVHRRLSHSLERKPEVVHEETIVYPVIKDVHQSPRKEPRVPKSEPLYVPNTHEESRYPRAEPTNHKPYIIPQNQPIQLPDYHSPYAIRTHKPYRERKFTPGPLPSVTQTHAERKPRPPLYEPRYRVEKHHPYAPLKSTSSERYPVNTKPRSSLWDNGYQTQTDDDEEYEKRLYKRKRSYKTSRPRAPWIPVW